MKSEETHYARYYPHQLTGALIPFDGESDDPEASRVAYAKYDSLYHWFIRPDGEGIATASIERPEEPNTVELLAMLITDTLKGFNKIDSVIMDVEPEWQTIRDTTSFVGGALAPDKLAILKSLLHSWLPDNTIYLDASQYNGDRDKGSSLPAFDALMNLAHNTKQVIEDGLVADHPADARRVLQFINTPSTGYLESDVDYESETKWFAEGRYLANELIKIRDFRENFNTVIIFGAHRYLLSDQLNLTKLYRLFAKLGRINTRLVFVG